MTTGCQTPAPQVRVRPSAAGEDSALSTLHSALLLLPALTSAALLWLCYFPVNWGWLAWGALVPLLCLVRSTARPRWVYLFAWISGLAFFWPALQWMRVADYRMYFTWMGLATVCALFVLLGIYLVRQLDRRIRLPLVITFPVVWTALEYFRAHLLGGFPWYFLSHTQHEFLPVIQITDLAGAYAVTFLIAAVNAMLFELLCLGPRFRAFFTLSETSHSVSGLQLIVQSSVVFLLLAGTLAYGAWRLSQNQFDKGPRIALLQGNVDQRIRNDVSEEAALEALRHYRDLCDEAIFRNPELIVWPETSFVCSWGEVASGVPDERVPDELQDANTNRLQLTRDVAHRWPTHLLLGLNARCLESDGPARWYNSAVLLQPDAQVAGRYDKIHCVPFGEFVPFRDWLPWMNAFAPYDFDYSLTPGKSFTRFALGQYHFGVVICYEDTDPYLARQYARPAAGQPAIDFLLNISNDGWFNGTSEHEEHLAICRFRAIECRRAVARAVNMGISAVIDGNGRIVTLPGRTWFESKKITTVLTSEMPIDRRASLYAAWGDWLPGSCWLLMATGIAWGFVRPAKE